MKRWSYIICWQNPSSFIVFLFFFPFWRTSTLAKAILLSKDSNVCFLESAAMDTYLGTICKRKKENKWHKRSKQNMAQKKTDNIISLTSFSQLQKKKKRFLSSTRNFLGKTTHAEQNPKFQMKNKFSILKKKLFCCVLMQ